MLLLARGGSIAVYHPDREPAQKLIAAVNVLDFRVVDARLAEAFLYRPHGKARGEPSSGILSATIDLRRRWHASGSAADGRLAAVAYLLAGRDDLALTVLWEVLRKGATESEALVLVQKCNDAALLTDLSAVALQRPDNGRTSLLAYEAADRAWRLSHAPAAAWNRALAADRIGISSFAARAWREAAVLDPGSGWAREAEERGRAAARRAAASPDPSLEMFFYRELFTRTIGGQPPGDVVPGDHLASEAALSFSRLQTDSNRHRLVEVLKTYLHGRDSFERNEYEDARRAYAAAECELDSLHAPLALIVRDQRIRAECSQARPGCLDAMRMFGRDVDSAGRYPWLAARAAYGEGQALYRQGRCYEAAERLQHALLEFDRLGDRGAAGHMHALLANVLAAAGESDLALRHLLDALQFRTPAIGDRRRKIVEDVMNFTLRHGYLATTELLLDELAASPATATSNVMEWMFRGVIAFRRGDAPLASRSFARARSLLRSVKDNAAREDVQFRLAVAEAGSRILPAEPVIAALDAGIGARERVEFSIWLPQLLTERGAAYEAANNAVRAEKDYRRAIDILETREPRIDETVISLGMTSQGESAFDHAIRLLLKQGRTLDALSIAQRSNALRISRLEAAGTNARDPYHHLQPASDGIAELRRQLHPHEVAVANHLLSDALVTWIVSEKDIRVVQQPVRSEELVRRTDRSGDVSAEMLRPWIEIIPRGTTLLIQPPAEMQGVPYSMLTTARGDRLLTRNPIATAPSFAAFADALRADGARRHGESAFFAAAPNPGGDLAPLPSAVNEVTRASASYTNPSIEPHATRARFLDHASSFSVVHFAGHVVVNTARPLYSALVFENGELLYVHEMEGRSFANARLVVLSGCESGRSPHPNMSVANALLSQGVPSVVFTLRPVPDEVAEAFAVAFHRAVAAGRSRAEALREAQLSLAARSSNNSEAWAAFALAGAPGPLRNAEKGESEDE